MISPSEFGFMGDGALSPGEPWSPRVARSRPGSLLRSLAFCPALTLSLLLLSLDYKVNQTCDMASTIINERSHPRPIFLSPESQYLSESNFHLGGHLGTRGAFGRNRI